MNISYIKMGKWLREIGQRVKFYGDRWITKILW